MTDHPTSFQLIVSDDEAGQRLDRWLTDNMAGLTRSRLQALIKDGHVSRDTDPFTNGSWKVRPGEVYDVNIPPATPLAVEAQPMALDVTFEDEHLLVLNKAPGLVVHPGAGNADGTLVNALMAHCGDSLSGIGGVARPGIVHRIDKDTSGLLVIAKHDKSHIGLSALFADHDIDREYLAIIHGALRPGVGTVDGYIARAKHDRKKMSVLSDADILAQQARQETLLERDDNNAYTENLYGNERKLNRPIGKYAVTHYRTLEKFGTGRAKLPGDALASLVSCTLETGRTHQIRVHMQSLGAPLLGDPVYGRGAGLAGLKPGEDSSDHALKILRTFKRQALHAAVLGFRHPITGEDLRFEADLPKDFSALAQALRDLG